MKNLLYKEFRLAIHPSVYVFFLLSALLLVPLVGNAFTQPGPLISFVGGVALCYALVIVGAVAANRTAARVARATTRADD